MIEDIEFDKPMKIPVSVYLTILFIALGVVSCSFVNRQAGLPDDNIAEELLETLIEMKTGINVDLTPEQW